MTNEPSDALWTEENQWLPLRELAERSGLSEALVREMVAYGALTPASESAQEWLFSMHSITIARAARRLGEEFDLEPHGVALVLAYLERIRDLEAQLRALHAQSPR